MYQSNGNYIVDSHYIVAIFTLIISKQQKHASRKLSLEPDSVTNLLQSVSQHNNIVSKAAAATGFANSTAAAIYHRFLSYNTTIEDFVTNHLDERKNKPSAIGKVAEEIVYDQLHIDLLFYPSKGSNFFDTNAFIDYINRVILPHTNDQNAVLLLDQSVSLQRG